MAESALLIIMLVFAALSAGAFGKARKHGRECERRMTACRKHD